MHQLEKLFNASSKDIMDAILRGFRSQVDVKGKLAELYLYKILKKMEMEGKIRKVEWTDADGEPDFRITVGNRILKIECKNVRNEIFTRPIHAFKVEIQKTRNSKDGTNTRSYRKDYFDILSVCTFNQTKKWEFLFVKNSDLEVVSSNPFLLKIMQRVPVKPQNPWAKNITELL